MSEKGKGHGKPDASWTDRVPGPTNIVWGEMTDPNLQAVAESLGANGSSWSRAQLLEFIDEHMPAGWHWDG